jgi:hypothetical protein
MRPTTKAEAIDFIKLKLGHPYQQIEISNEQFDAIISEALEFYTKNVYEGTAKALVVLTTTHNVMEYDLGATGYPGNIWAISEIINGESFSGMFPIPYGFTESDINFLFNLGKLHAGTTITDFSVTMQNIELYKTMMIPKMAWDFNFNTNVLTFTTNPGDKNYLMNCVLLADYEGNSTSKFWANTFFLDYATAIAKIYWGYNLGPKFTGLNLPGGGQIRPDTLIDKGESEKEKLQEFAFKNLCDMSALFAIRMA